MRCHDLRRLKRLKIKANLSPIKRKLKRKTFFFHSIFSDLENFSLHLSHNHTECFIDLGKLNLLKISLPWSKSVKLTVLSLSLTQTLSLSLSLTHFSSLSTSLSVSLSHFFIFPLALPLSSLSLFISHSFSLSHISHTHKHTLFPYLFPSLSFSLPLSSSLFFSLPLSSSLFLSLPLSSSLSNRHKLVQTQEFSVLFPRRL